MKKLAFSDLRDVILKRIMAVSQDSRLFFTPDSQDPTKMIRKKHSALASALMKSVCYSRSWIEEVSVKRGE